MRFFGADAPTHTREQKEELETGERLLQEFLSSDIVVIGAPMYNFNIPSQLKAWIDLICVPGTTFRYGPKGPEGLCGGKKMVIVSSRGGLYGAGSPFETYDFQEKYLKAVFNFLGITDIQMVRAEGVGSGPEKASAAIAAAKEQIAKL